MTNPLPPQSTRLENLLVDACDSPEWQQRVNELLGKTEITTTSLTATALWHNKGDKEQNVNVALQECIAGYESSQWLQGWELLCNLKYPELQNDVLKNNGSIQAWQKYLQSIGIDLEDLLVIDDKETVDTFDRTRYPELSYHLIDNSSVTPEQRSRYNKLSELLNIKRMQLGRQYFFPSGVVLKKIYNKENNFPAFQFNRTRFDYCKYQQIQGLNIDGLILAVGSVLRVGGTPRLRDTERSNRGGGQLSNTQNILALARFPRRARFFSDYNDWDDLNRFDDIAFASIADD